MSESPQREADTRSEPRQGMLRLLDRVEAVTFHESGLSSLHTYYWNRRGVLLHGDPNGFAAGEKMSWDELLAKYDAVVVRHWRRALDWLLFVAAMLISLSVLAGFALGGGFAMAAGAVLGVAVLGGGLAVLYHFAIGRW